MNRFLLIGLLLVGGLFITLTMGVAISTGLAETAASAWQTEVVDATDCWFPSLALDSAGQPRISYGAAGELKFARHNGAAWALEFVEEQPGSTGWYSSLVLDSLDNSHISYYSPYSNTLMYTRYYSESWHIEPVTNTADLGGQTSLALDSLNRPYIAYWDSPNLAVKIAYHDGVDWQINTVDTMMGSGQNVSLALALDTADQPHLCYYDYDAGALKYAFHNGSNWQLDTVDDAVFYNGQNCSIALDAQDQPHISYRDLGLLYAHNNGSSWQTATVDDDFFAGDGSSLVLDHYDQPHISYTDWAVPDYEVRYAFFAGSSWWIEIVDTIPSGQSFAETSLALDNIDRPHIGYWQVGNPDILKYAARDAAPIINQVYLPLIVR